MRRGGCLNRVNLDRNGLPGSCQPPVATGSRTSRFGSLVPKAAVARYAPTFQSSSPRSFKDSRRTKDALAAKKAQGIKLGGLNARGIANHDEAIERADQLRPVFAELAGRSARATAAVLNERKIATPTGGRWHAATVIRVQKRIAEGRSD